MIKVSCITCGEELTQPGGLLISPPAVFKKVKGGEAVFELMEKSPIVAKEHLCVRCYGAAKEVFRQVLESQSFKKVKKKDGRPPYPTKVPKAPPKPDRRTSRCWNQ